MHLQSMRRPMWQTLTTACALAALIFLTTLSLHAEEPIASGEFYDAHHPTSGRAVLVAREDGRYELRLEDFTSNDGPDIFIYLRDAKNPATDSAIKNAHNANLGQRQALTGEQSYILPKGVSPDGFKSVAIWCRATDATLNQPTPQFSTTSVRQENTSKDNNDDHDRLCVHHGGL
jgi:hypothetical protein